MHSSICLLLVTCLAASCQAIRVDWGTNTGPIVPPPPRTTPTPPRQPYREPAPVWEDQSDDIPNPKPYVYVLPPPSRPRTWVIPAGPYAPPNYNNQPPKPRNYAELVRPGNAPAGAAAAVGTVSVPGLAAQYVPGVGIKYTAIVTDKLQGKYNAKTKKYKAYEKGYDKGKYVPWNYLQLLPLMVQPEEQLDGQQPQQQQQVAPLGSSTTTTAAPSSSTTQQPTTTTTNTTTTTTTAATAAAAGAAEAAAAGAAAGATVANYKLAHEKSAYLKKHNKLKKLLEQMQMQAHNSSSSNNISNSSSSALTSS